MKINKLNHLQVRRFFPIALQAYPHSSTLVDAHVPNDSGEHVKTPLLVTPMEALESAPSDSDGCSHA